LCSRSSKRSNSISRSALSLGRWIALGELVTTHGINGWLKLKPYNPETQAFRSAETVRLEKEGKLSQWSLQDAKPFKGNFLIKLREVDEISAAEKLVGSVLSVEAGPLGPGEFYYLDVMGFTMIDRQGNRLGEIAKIWSKPGGDLFVVTDASKEYLIPIEKEFIDRVDYDQKTVAVDLPEGFLDL